MNKPDITSIMLCYNAFLSHIQQHSPIPIETLRSDMRRYYPNPEDLSTALDYARRFGIISHLHDKDGSIAWCCNMPNSQIKLFPIK